MASELKKRGHEVLFYTVKGGRWKEHFETLGPVYGKPQHADLILCNHVSCQRELIKKNLGPIIRTCHGPIVREEQPLEGASCYVSVSEEVQENLANQGFPSTVIRNGIDPDLFQNVSCETFKILMMSDFPENSEVVKKACDRIGAELHVIGNQNPVWQPIKEMSEASVIISLGRGAYEGLMLDKAVVIADGIADGWLTPETWPTFVKRNCSGRTNKATWTEDQWVEVLNSYAQPIGHRSLALEHHNSQVVCDKYLGIAKQLGA